VRKDCGTAAELVLQSHKNANYGGRNKVRVVRSLLRLQKGSDPSALWVYRGGGAGLRQQDCFAWAR